MGKPLVYCNSCGSRLSDQDFAQGRAHVDDFVSYCTKCRPAGAPTPAPARKEKSPTRTPTRTPATSPPPPPPDAAPSRLPLYLGGGALIVAILVGLILVLGRSEPPQAPEPPPAAAAAAKADVGPTLKLLDDLLAASKDMDTVIRRCDELEPLVKGTPQEARLREIRRRAEAASFKVDTGRPLDFLLEQVRKLQDLDPRFERHAEVENLLKKAVESAGPRRGEVEAALADYRSRYRREADRIEAEEKARAAAPAKGAEPRLRQWMDWKIVSTDQPPAIAETHDGKPFVLITHPLSPDQPATLERDFAVPAGRNQLRFWVATLETGDWELRVVIDNVRVMADSIVPAKPRWKEVRVDLSSYAGRTIHVRLENAANGWSWEQGVWTAAEIQPGAVADADEKRRRRKEIWSPWKIDCGAGGGMPVFLDSHYDRSFALRTHPHAKDKPGFLEREFTLPAGREIEFGVWVTHLLGAEWQARVLVGDAVLANEKIAGALEWRRISVDLSRYAGTKITLRLENGARNWNHDYAYWSDPELVLKK